MKILGLRTATVAELHLVADLFSIPSHRARGFLLAAVTTATLSLGTFAQNAAAAPLPMAATEAGAAALNLDAAKVALAEAKAKAAAAEAAVKAAVAAQKKAIAAEAAEKVAAAAAKKAAVARADAEAAAAIAQAKAAEANPDKEPGVAGGAAKAVNASPPAKPAAAVQPLKTAADAAAASAHAAADAADAAAASKSTAATAVVEAKTAAANAAPGDAAAQAGAKDKAATAKSAETTANSVAADAAAKAAKAKTDAAVAAAMNTCSGVPATEGSYLGNLKLQNNFTRNVLASVELGRFHTGFSKGYTTSHDYPREWDLGVLATATTQASTANQTDYIKQQLLLAHGGLVTVGFSARTLYQKLLFNSARPLLEKDNQNEDELMDKLGALPACNRKTGKAMEAKENQPDKIKAEFGATPDPRPPLPGNPPPPRPAQVMFTDATLWPTAALQTVLIRRQQVDHVYVSSEALGNIGDPEMVQQLWGYFLDSITTKYIHTSVSQDQGGDAAEVSPTIGFGFDGPVWIANGNPDTVAPAGFMDIQLRLAGNYVNRHAMETMFGQGNKYQSVTPVVGGLFSLNVTDTLAAKVEYEGSVGANRRFLKDTVMLSVSYSLPSSVSNATTPANVADKGGKVDQDKGSGADSSPN